MTDVKDAVARSEEHTSELQSRQYLVCRLLLEKNKTRRRDETTWTHTSRGTLARSAPVRAAQRRSLPLQRPGTRLSCWASLFFFFFKGGAHHQSPPLPPPPPPPD